MYGRVDIAKFLVSQEACTNALTEGRELTGLHLLMYVRRHEEFDIGLFECLR